MGGEGSSQHLQGSKCTSPRWGIDSLAEKQSSGPSEGEQRSGSGICLDVSQGTPHKGTPRDSAVSDIRNDLDWSTLEKSQIMRQRQQTDRLAVDGVLILISD
jgi:hypothetical protein